MLRLAQVDAVRLKELVTDAWRMRAPDALVGDLDHVSEVDHGETGTTSRQPPARRVPHMHGSTTKINGRVDVHNGLPASTDCSRPGRCGIGIADSAMRGSTSQGPAGHPSAAGGPFAAVDRDPGIGVDSVAGAAFLPLARRDRRRRRPRRAAHADPRSPPGPVRSALRRARRYREQRRDLRPARNRGPGHES
jgi:hypothetical protein